jgi:hypothetical protein
LRSGKNAFGSDDDAHVVGRGDFYEEGRQIAFYSRQARYNPYRTFEERRFD